MLAESITDGMQLLKTENCCTAALLHSSFTFKVWTDVTRLCTGRQAMPSLAPS